MAALSDSTPLRFASPRRAPHHAASLHDTTQHSRPRSTADVNGPQLTLADALRDRDLALERVEDAADPDWRGSALAALERTARALPEFISDDVWSNGLPSTREDRALGPVFLAAARAGWIEKTDRVRPSRRSHGSGKPIWRSLIIENERVAG